LILGGRGRSRGKAAAPPPPPPAPNHQSTTRQPLTPQHLQQQQKNQIAACAGALAEPPSCSAASSYVAASLAMLSYPSPWGLAKNAATPGTAFACQVSRSLTALGATPGSFSYADSSYAHSIVFTAGSRVYVVFRGTDSPASTTRNSDITKRTLSLFKDGGKDSSVGVSNGFYSQYATIRDATLANVGAALRAVPGGKGGGVVVIGHSLGGGHAQYATLEMRSLGLPVERTLVFGSVRAGDGAWDDLYTAKAGGDRTCRWWNQYDNIPLLPAAIMGYPQPDTGSLLRILPGADGDDDSLTCGAASAHKGWEKDCPTGYSCDFGQGFGPNTHHEMKHYRAGLRACAEGGKAKLPACLVAALTAS
jgi:hypothetical protein